MAYEAFNRLVNDLHDQAVLEAAAEHLSGRVLDIGCGTKPFADRLADLVDEHIGVDLVSGPHGLAGVDLIGTAYDVPVPDSSFDGALCTAVLEHLEEPGAALRECRRILKPGGTAIYTAPFMWHLHEAPRDFFRYTPFGLEHLFRESGLEVLSIRPLAGFWVTFGQELCYIVWRANRGWVARLGLLLPVVKFISALARRLDRWDSTPEWAWMHIIVARKPLGDAQP